MKFFFFNIFIISILMPLSYQMAEAQYAPVTSVSSIGNVLPGQQVSVQIRVTNFKNIGSVSLSLNYDSACLHFVSGSINSQMAATGNFAIGDNNIGNGMRQIKAGWYGNVVSLTDQSIILTYDFIYKSGNSILQWFDDGASCSYTDEVSNILIDTPASLFYNNGNICGSIFAPAAIVGPASICQGTTSVNYSVSPLMNAKRYIWSVPGGATIISGANTNSITVSFPAIAPSGTIAVYGENDCNSGPDMSMQISPTSPPVAYAGKDTTIISGGYASLSGNSSGSANINYHWSPETLVVDPNIQNTYTGRLTASTVFTLKVSDKTTLCYSSDDIQVIVRDITTGVEETSTINKDSGEDEFRIFPNPVKEHFYIRFNNSTNEKPVISIMSSNGLLIRKPENNIPDGESDILFNVGYLKSGIYYVNVKIGNRVRSKKIIIL